jgi:Bacterial regulatory helix-turn-helix protein, lysR family
MSAASIQEPHREDGGAGERRMDCVEERQSVVNKLEAMQIFVRVAEKGSFSAVAKERGIGQPAVSKQISALEDELGTELIPP